MKRTPLKQGKTIVGDRRYIIDSLAGAGANCLAYNAHYSDQAGYEHSVIIKECYPYKCSINRNFEDLEWENLDDKQVAVEKFKKSYVKLMKAQDSNNTTVAFDSFDSNNTSYTITHTDSGITYDKDNDASIVQHLQTALALTKAVENFHKNNYLHLDIKPSNFLVLPETRELVKLFDFDTIISKSEIMNAEAISYSEDYAAPEQLKMQRTKICDATDLFAIGAILFEKIMGRKASSADMGIFAKWTFDEARLDNTNPRIKRLLNNIFHKTINVNVKRRYQCASELAEALSEAISVANETMYFANSIPGYTIDFVGRQLEIQQIKDSFSSGKKVVMLHGVGGIGKSELAKKYANSVAKNYDAVQFLRYRGSLQSIVHDDIDIINNSDEKIEKRYKTIKTLLKDNKVLFIVDNYDVLIGDDTFFDEFLELNADFLFTSRTDHKAVLNECMEQIEVSNLGEPQACDIFAKIAGIDLSNSTLNDSVKKVIEYIDAHTLTTTLLAKQCVSSGMSTEEMLLKLEEGISSLKHSEKVLHKKDNEIFRSNTYDILKITFNMSKLSRAQKAVLRNLYLSRFMYVNKRIYKRIFQSEDNVTDSINAINELIELGWINTSNRGEDDPYLEVHTLIFEIVKNELCVQINEQSSIDNYLYSLMPKKMDENAIDEIESWDALEQDTGAESFSVYCACLNSLLSDRANYEYVVNKMYLLIDGSINAIHTLKDIPDCNLTSFGHSFGNGYYEKLIMSLERVATSRNAYNCMDYGTLIKLFEVISVVKIEKAFWPWYSQDKAYEKRKKAENLIDAVSWFIASYEKCKNLSLEKRGESLFMLMKPVMEMYLEFYLYDEAKYLQYLIDNYISPSIEQLRTFDAEYVLNWKESVSCKRRFAKEYEDSLSEVLHDQEYDQDLKAETYYDDYLAGIPVEDINDMILSDNELSYLKKMDAYLNIVSNELFSAHVRCDFNHVNWEHLYKLLEYMDAIFIDDENSDYNDTTYMEEERFLVKAHDKYMAIVCGGLDKCSDFEFYAKELFSYEKRKVDHWNKNNGLPYQYLHFSDYREMIIYYDIAYITEDLEMLNKGAYILPYLIDLEHYIADSLEIEISDECMYSWNKLINSIAEGAWNTETDELKKSEYWNIHCKYEEYITQCKDDSPVLRT